ncbi:MAG: cyclic nucleotide-binding domain-containing protein [Proteobacteria bacterium]|nr:cyclic nucleotide-binding domain-containing protein [Pseudomonadota bacterium]
MSGAVAVTSPLTTSSHCPFLAWNEKVPSTEFGSTAYLKASTQPRPVGEQRPDVAQRLQDLCVRMLATAPEARPASFDEVLEELAALADFGEGAAQLGLLEGDVLFERGDAGTTAFQILEGTMSISVPGSDGPRVIATRGPGDIIGELAMLSPSPRTATVTAATRAVVRALDWEALEAELAKVNPLIGQMMRSLADKLVESTEL